MNFSHLPRAAAFASLTLCLAFASTVRAEAELPQFRSVLIDGQAPMFSLADATGSGRWVKVGESFEGWKVLSFDSATQVLTVGQGDARKELSLIAARLTDATASGATLAEADAVLQKMRFEEMIQKTLEAQQKAMAKSMGSMLGQNMPESERARFVEFQRKVMDVMFQEMDVPGMRQDVARIYADNFSSAELKAQSDFYSTPAGQAMIDKQPIIQEQMTALMMPRMMKAMPKIQALGQDFARETAAQSKPAAPATP